MANPKRVPPSSLGNQDSDPNCSGSPDPQKMYPADPIRERPKKPRNPGYHEGDLMGKFGRPIKEERPKVVLMHATGYPATTVNDDVRDGWSNGRAPTADESPERPEITPASPRTNIGRAGGGTDKDSRIAD
jgi:hypothetical protein